MCAIQEAWHRPDRILDALQGEEAKNTLYYIIAFPSAEAQKKAWQEFRSDPEWIKVKADSEKEGVLVNKVDSMNLKPTDYSPLR